MRDEQGLLRQLLEANEISQAEFAKAIGRSEALVSRLVSGALDPSKDTIDKTLEFLSSRLKRAVLYEEIFSEPAVAAARGRSRR